MSESTDEPTPINSGGAKNFKFYEQIPLEKDPGVKVEKVFITHYSKIFEPLRDMY